MRAGLRLALSAAIAVFLSGPALAFEEPPVTTAEAVLGDLAKGRNYSVDPEVRSDGLLHLFVLRTASGPFEVAGDDLMRERIREMGALRKLQSMSESDVFLKSLGQTAAAPLRYGADLITDPAKTLRKSASGISNMFDRVGAGLNNRAASRDNVATSLLGVDSARRVLAVQLGVDPYTDFPPLASKLSDIASAAAFGGLSVKALMVAIPGGAGVAVSSASGADTIRATLAEKTSAQIAEQVLGLLARQKVPASAANRLVANRFYSPADLLVLSQSLATLKAGNAGLFVARAAEASSREEAFFQRRRAMLLASNRSMGIGAFVNVGGLPLNKLQDGRLIALFPLDEIAWTERVARLFDQAGQAATAAGAAGAGAPVLATTGTLTPLAAQEIAQRGWTVQRLN